MLMSYGSFAFGAIECLYSSNVKVMQTSRELENINHRQVTVDSRKSIRHVLQTQSATVNDFSRPSCDSRSLARAHSPLGVVFALFCHPTAVAAEPISREAQVFRPNTPPHRHHHYHHHSGNLLEPQRLRPSAVHSRSECSQQHQGTAQPTMSTVLEVRRL